MANLACDKRHFHKSHHNMWQGNQNSNTVTRHHHYRTAQSPKQIWMQSGTKTDHNVDSRAKFTNASGSATTSTSKKPLFLRLDSTGENSSSNSSSGYSSSGHSPQPEPDYVPNFQSGPGLGPSSSSAQATHHWQNQTQDLRTKPSQPQGHGQAHQGGLLDRVRSAFVHSQNSGSRRFLVHQRTGPGTGGQELDSSLANLDLVAEKFTNMSCNMMSRDAPGGGGGGVHGHGNWQMDGNQSYTAPLMDRTFPPNHREAPRVQYFHPYVGTMDQSKFTQNYRRTCSNYQPWQQMMGRTGNQPFHQPFHQRGFFPCNQQMAWQQQQQHYWCAPPSWDQWNWNRSAGNGRMMQHQCNVPSGNWPHNQGYRTSKPQHCSPKRKPRNCNSSRKQTSPSARSKVTKDTTTSDDALAKEQSIPESLPRCQEEERIPENEYITSSGLSADESKTLGDASAIDSSITNTSRPASTTKSKSLTENVAAVSPDSPKPTADIESVELPSSVSSPKTEGSPNEQSESNAQTAGNESSEKSDANGKQVSDDRNLGFQRHSSIELILCDYESQTSTADENVKISTDSDFSDVECETSVNAQSDLWESFNASDDPYNPLSGWRCSEKSVTDAASEQSCKFIQDTCIDSGTDEGDDLSETDCDDDGSSSESADDDEDDSSPPHQSSQTKQLVVENHERNLSSTPKKASVQSTPAHHSSVAFVLGSSSSSDDSDDDGDDDDDWDTVDSSTLRDDPLWDSLNRASDPYSPMNSWRCHSSGLYSSKCPQNAPSIDIPDGSSLLQTLRRDSVERLRVDRVQPPRVERSESILSYNRASSRDSLSESGSFTIQTIRVHAAKDDLDCALLSPKTEESLMKRVASASCLRSAHPTQELRTTRKKVRFSPSSSFIVLVEKDLLASADNPCGEAGGTDWLVCARDRMRFRARIDQTATALDSVLLSAHREQVYQTRFSANADR